MAKSQGCEKEGQEVNRKIPFHFTLKPIKNKEIIHQTDCSIVTRYIQGQMATSLVETSETFTIINRGLADLLLELAGALMGEKMYQNRLILRLPTDEISLVHFSRSITKGSQRNYLEWLGLNAYSFEYLKDPRQELNGNLLGAIDVVADCFRKYFILIELIMELRPIYCLANLAGGVKPGLTNMTIDLPGNGSRKSAWKGMPTELVDSLNRTQMVNGAIFLDEKQAHIGQELTIRPTPTDLASLNKQLTRQGLQFKDAARRVLMVRFRSRDNQEKGNQ